MKDPLVRRKVFMRMRIVMLACLLLAGAGAVVNRAYDLQVRRAPGLKEMAEEQYLRDVSLDPKRGNIYDRDGAELAVSVDVDSVWANPRALRKRGGDPQEIAERLSGLLGVDAEVLVRRLSSDRHFVWIKRRVSPTQGKAIRALKLPGVSISGEARRFYPNRELAAHVLGFANVDGKGIEGIELSLEDKLRGPDKTIPAVLDRRGEVVFSETLLDDRAAQGDSVVLTIDKTIQHLAEREIELAVRTTEAHAASIVVLEPSTGEILALANYPTFNPNEPTKSPGANRRNRAVTDRFEPGSTVKPMTIAGALAAGAITPSQTIACENGALRVAEYTIRDTHKWDLLTPGQILTVSSNIGTAKAGLALGRAGLHRTLTRFGFGEISGIALPGETAGALRHYKRWYEMDAATIAFGQGMSTTSLQIAMAMGALANKGRLMTPQIVKRVLDPQGNVVTQVTPRVRRQVVPESVARLVTDMMIGVTGPSGTGTEAAVGGYLVAGKTGTAQKADYVRGGYADGKWTSSFVGYAPAERPRLLISVVIDEPIIAHQGGGVAGPVFRRVMEASLRHLGVPASAQGTLTAQRGKATSMRAEVEREEQIPAVVVSEPSPSVAENERLVPSLLGKSARAAVVLASQEQLDVRVVGTGLVHAQDPKPGAVVPAGTVLTLQLTPPSYEDDRSSGDADAITPVIAGGTHGSRPREAVVAVAPLGGHGG